MKIGKGSPFTYSDIADRTDFRLKLTKRGERAVLRSSPQSQDRSRVIFRINQKKDEKENKNKKRKAAKFSFMYLVSNKKAFCLL